MRKTIGNMLLLLIATLILIYAFCKWEESTTYAVFQYEGYLCWIEKGMIDNTAFCIKGDKLPTGIDIATGKLKTLNMLTGEISDVHSKWSLHHYYK